MKKKGITYQEIRFAVFSGQPRSTKVTSTQTVHKPPGKGRRIGRRVLKQMLKMVSGDSH